MFFPEKTWKSKDEIDTITLIQQNGADKILQIEKDAADKVDSLRKENDMALLQSIKQAMKLYDIEQELASSEFDLLKKTEGEKTRFTLKAEIDRWKKILELNETSAEKMSDQEVQIVKNTIARIEKEYEKSEKRFKSLGDKLNNYGLKIHRLFLTNIIRLSYG